MVDTLSCPFFLHPGCINSRMHSYVPKYTALPTSSVSFNCIKWVLDIQFFLNISASSATSEFSAFNSFRIGVKYLNNERLNPFKHALLAMKLHMGQSSTSSLRHQKYINICAKLGYMINNEKDNPMYKFNTNTTCVNKVLVSCCQEFLYSSNN